MAAIPLSYTALVLTQSQYISSPFFLLLFFPFPSYPSYAPLNIAKVGTSLKHRISSLNFANYFPWLASLGSLYPKKHSQAKLLLVTTVTRTFRGSLLPTVKLTESRHMSNKHF